MDPVYFTYKLGNILHKHGVPVLPFLIRGFMRVIFACDIPCSTSIGDGTLFPHHALGVVINPYAVIGKNCVIRQNCTIGGRKGIMTLPVLEDNVSLGAGAMVLGPVRIGANSEIGAGAVVIDDIPANSVAVGVPARCIKQKLVHNGEN